jgi:hypothetical protein
MRSGSARGRPASVITPPHPRPLSLGGERGEMIILPKATRQDTTFIPTGSQAITRPLR